MGKTIKLVDKSEDNRHWSVRDMLEDAIRSIDEGKINMPEKAFLVMLAPKIDDPDTTSAIHLKAGMADIYETVGILDLVKTDIIIQFFKED